MGHMDTELLWGIVTALGAAGLLIAEHYFPFARLRGGQELHRTAAYVLGCLALLLPFSVWGLAFGYVVPVLVIWIITALGGLAVLGSYALDRMLDARDQEKANARLRDALSRGPADREP